MVEIKTGSAGKYKTEVTGILSEGDIDLTIGINICGVSLSCI